MARQREVTRALRKSLHIRPGVVVELSTLGREDRRAEINKRRRTGVIATMEEFELLDAEGLKALESIIGANARPTQPLGGRKPARSS